MQQRGGPYHGRGLTRTRIPPPRRVRQQAVRRNISRQDVKPNQQEPARACPPRMFFCVPDTHRPSQELVTKAGPRLRAGFMLAPVNGTASMCAAATVNPMGSGAISLLPRRPTAVENTCATDQLPLGGAQARRPMRAHGDTTRVSAKVNMPSISKASGTFMLFASWWTPKPAAG